MTPIGAVETDAMMAKRERAMAMTLYKVKLRGHKGADSEREARQGSAYTAADWGAVPFICYAATIALTSLDYKWTVD